MYQCTTGSKQEESVRLSMSIDTHWCVSILKQYSGQSGDWVSIHTYVYRYSVNTVLNHETEYPYTFMCIDTQQEFLRVLTDDRNTKETPKFGLWRLKSSKNTNKSQHIHYIMKVLRSRIPTSQVLSSNFWKWNLNPELQLQQRKWRSSRAPTRE